MAITVITHDIHSGKKRFLDRPVANMTKDRNYAVSGNLIINMIKSKPRSSCSEVFINPEKLFDTGFLQTARASPEWDDFGHNGDRSVLDQARLIQQQFVFHPEPSSYSASSIKIISNRLSENSWCISAVGWLTRLLRSMVVSCVSLSFFHLA